MPFACGQEAKTCRKICFETYMCSQEIGIHRAILLLWGEKKPQFWEEVGTLPKWVLVQSNFLSLWRYTGEYMHKRTTLAKHTRTQMCLNTQTKGHALMKLIWHEISRQDLTHCRVVTVETAVGFWMDWCEQNSQKSPSGCFSRSQRRSEPNHVRCRDQN